MLNARSIRVNVLPLEEEILPREICRHQGQRTPNQMPSKTRFLTGTVLGASPTGFVPCTIQEKLKN